MDRRGFLAGVAVTAVAAATGAKAQRSSEPLPAAQPMSTYYQPGPAYARSIEEQGEPVPIGPGRPCATVHDRSPSWEMVRRFEECKGEACIDSLYCPQCEMDAYLKRDVEERVERGMVCETVKPAYGPVGKPKTRTREKVVFDLRDIDDWRCEPTAHLYRVNHYYPGDLIDFDGILDAPDRSLDCPVEALWIE